jgi:TniQ
MSLVTPRRRLYPLAPAGLGTPLVEALSSYVMRLAAAHHTSVSALIRWSAPNLAPSPFARTGNIGDLAAAGGFANGMGRHAAAWVAAFEAATGRADLAQLTRLAWSEVVSPIGLMRKAMAHCMTCLAEMAVAGLVYEPLLWVLDGVVACPTHGERLAILCPHCGRTQPPLHLWARPGICRRCRRWLVGPSSPLSATQVELARTRTIAHLVAAPMAAAGPLRLRAAIEAAIAASATAKDFAIKADVPESSLSNWRHAASRPSLDAVLAMCAVGPWDPAAFFAGSLTVRVFEAGEAQVARRPRKRIDWARSRSRVLARLGDDPPITVNAMAKELSIDVRWLRLHLPEETELLKERFAAWAKKRSATRRARIKDLVTAATLALLERDGRAPRQLVERCLPPEIQLRERIVWETWRDVRASWQAADPNRAQVRLSNCRAPLSPGPHVGRQPDRPIYQRRDGMRSVEIDGETGGPQTR